MRRFIAVDDCGTRINPIIIEGQVHGGLTDGVGMALMELIAFDEEGNCLGGSLMDYLDPDRAGGARLGDRLHGHPVAAPPDRREGRSASRATVGSPPTIVNAVCDALKPYGVRHMDMPCTPVAGVGRHAGEGGATAMIAGALARTAERLREGGEPFVHATVVRAQHPTSVHAGDAAIVHPRRHDRRVRRRALRAGVGAPARRAGPGDGRAAPAADRPRARGGGAAGGRRRRPQPVPVGRRVRGVPRAAGCRRRGWS